MSAVDNAYMRQVEPGDTRIATGTSGDGRLELAMSTILPGDEPDGVVTVIGAYWSGWYGLRIAARIAVDSLRAIREGHR